MRKMMFALAIAAMTTTTASAQSSGPANAFFGGLGAYGTGGSYRQPLPPQTARTINAPKVTPQVNRHVRGCDWLCQRKCQATWQRGGLPNVEACYTKWARLNANPELARACEYKSRQEQRRLGCGL
jgi:hypothetical protein